MLKKEAYESLTPGDKVVVDAFIEKFDSTKNDLQTQIDKLNQKHHSSLLFSKMNDTLVDMAVKSTGDMIKSFKEGQNFAKSDLTVKSGALDMGLTTTTGAGVVLADRERGIQSAPERDPVILNVIQTGSTNSNTIEWVEKTDETGAPAFKKEFETLPKRSWKTVVKQALVKKIGVIAEYSKEILEDVDGFQQELRDDLIGEIRRVLDHNLLYGQGGEASDADMKGILEYCQAWTNIISGKVFPVENPNIFDVIAVGINQIEEEHHKGSVILMRPSTALTMQLTKDKNGMYILPPFSAVNGQIVKGLPVVTNTLLQPDEIVIMDGRKAKYFFKRNWQLELTDSHSDNFEKDVLTVKLTGRGVLRIKDVDAKAFVHVASVKDAITALEPSS